MALAAVLLGASSCQKDQVESPKTSFETAEIDPANPVVQMILADGWDISKIQRTRSGDFIVGGDVLFRNDINFYKKKGDNSTKQATRFSLIDPANVTNIRVFIDWSVISYINNREDLWSDATVEAMNIWNNVANSNVNFTRTYWSGNADIIVSSDNGDFPNNFVAFAEFPVNGNPGRTVRINLDFDSNRRVTDASKLHNMVHELGHCLGFRHTNWQALGENPANPVAGTPTVDPNSVMNGQTANNDFVGLTAFDELMIATVY